jgi:hypothetical protein
MTVSRRGFIEYGKVLAAACVVPRSWFTFSLQAATGGKNNLGEKDATAFLQNMTRESIAPFVKSTWTVHSEPGKQTYLTLSAVKEIAAPAAAQQQAATVPPERSLRTPAVIDTFVLEFQGIGDALPQGTYEMEHAKLGAFSLFIVPAESPTYIAVISHIVSGSANAVPPVKAPRLIKPLIPVGSSDSNN